MHRDRRGDECAVCASGCGPICNSIKMESSAKGGSSKSLKNAPATPCAHALDLLCFR